MKLNDFGGTITAVLTYPGALPVSSAVLFRFKRPDGTTVDKDTVLTPVKKTAVYTIEEDFLSQVGMWWWEPRLYVDGLLRLTADEAVQFEVSAALAEPE